MKNYIGDEELGRMGISQECLQGLADVGYLPAMIDTTDGPAIGIGDFGRMFECLAHQCVTLRRTLIEAEEKRRGTAGVHFAPESSEIEEGQVADAG